MSDLTTAITNSITSATNFAVNTANAAVNNAVAAANAAANVAVTQINAALATPGVLQFASAHVILSAPVSPGVTLNMPSNTDSQVALLDPLQFQGTIDFNGSIPGVVANGPPSLVGLIGVGADHWTFSPSTSVLTLFAGNQVTDTLKITPSAAGFGVFAVPSGLGPGLPGGVLIGSASPTAYPPSVVVPLPGALAP